MGPTNYKTKLFRRVMFGSKSAPRIKFVFDKIPPYLSLHLIVGNIHYQIMFYYGEHHRNIQLSF
jgi:hypothetical protein